MVVNVRDKRAIVNGAINDPSIRQFSVMFVMSLLR